jgi:aminoglycoside phosphotransferase (APT) family kinase protein
VNGVTAYRPRIAPAEPLVEQALPSLLEYVGASGLQAVVVGASKDPNAKLVVLLVSPASSRPVLAVKAPTTDAAASAVAVEERLLAALRPLLPDALADAIPEVVGAVDYRGRRAAVTTAMHGKPMSTSFIAWRHTASRHRVEADFAAVAAWVEELQRATAVGRGPVDLDGGAATRLRQRFARDPGLLFDLRRLSELHERLGRSSTPRTAVHGDLWFANVLVDRGRVSGVVDWEWGRLEGEPLRDLVRFAHMYALYLDRRTRPGRRVAGHAGLRADHWGAGLAHAIHGRGWFPDVYRRFLQDGLARLGASPSLWRDAALAGIAEVAAFTDDPEFARRHFELFRRLASHQPPRKDTP